MIYNNKHILLSLTKIILKYIIFRSLYDKKNVVFIYHLVEVLYIVIKKNIYMSWNTLYKIILKDYSFSYTLIKLIKI